MSQLEGVATKVPDPELPGSVIKWNQGSGSEMNDFESGPGSSRFSHQTK